NTNEVTEKDDEVIVKPGVVTENADNVTMAYEVQPTEQRHADVNLSEILKDLVEYKVQSMVDVPIKQVTPAALRHPLIDSTVTLNLKTTTDLSSQPPPTQPKRIKIKQMMKKSHTPCLETTSFNCRLWQLGDKVHCYSFPFPLGYLSYDSAVISEVPISEPNQDNSMLDNCVQEMYYSEQPTSILLQILKLHVIAISSHIINI
ncbi:hypothetical protein Tco_1350515, partial [Tanacetum coccineum]